MYAFATMHKHKMQSELEPRVRYVIHRGFVNETNDPESECLILTTDVRSGKASDIAMRPSAPVEIAWYISQERIQVRMLQVDIKVSHSWLGPCVVCSNARMATWLPGCTTRATWHSPRLGPRA